MYWASIVGPKSNDWGFFMSKCNFNFKIKVVKFYLDGEDGIGSETQCKTWVKVYKTLGKDRLKRKITITEIK